jgi:hypothetical protein
MSFLYSVLGTVAVLVLFFGGAFAGWKAKAFLDRRVARNQVKELGLAERRELEQQNEAFQVMQNYNAERAYGLVTEEPAERGDRR